MPDITDMPKAAIFWDRDGTLIEDPGYLRDPDQVRLLPGAAEAIKRLSAAGFENIVATNQSGVARGMMDEAAVGKVNQRLSEMLAHESAAIDAFYYCPYLDGPDAVVEAYRRDSDLRKPRPGMLLKASLERNLDLPASWSIGDSVRDAEAGRAAGCRTILISSDGEAETNTTRRSVIDFVVRSPVEAADLVMRYAPGAAGDAAPVKAAEEAAGKENSGPAMEAAARNLSEILSIFQRMDRRARTEDFSLPRLGAAILQMIALAALIWAIFGLNEPNGTQLIRLTYAVVFQLMALTLFIAGIRR